MPPIVNSRPGLSAAIMTPDMMELNLPDGINSRMVETDNGLNMHILEAGSGGPDRPVLLLLHGFPELAYSWRRIMLPLAGAGFYVVAPDQRGYGQTTGWDPAYDSDLKAFAMPNLVADATALLKALNRDSVAAVIGHDFGSPVAGWAALTRPDIFRSVVLMSAPFGGIPASRGSERGPPQNMDAELAKLEPPRRHYQNYYGRRDAEDNMLNCPAGVHNFLRAYYHMKSGDWPGNKPHPLEGYTASALSGLPTYYVMDRDMGMAETVAAEMPSPEEIARADWLTEVELKVYSDSFSATGLQGGLQWYRAGAGPDWATTYAGQTIDQPACFIGGKSDWGVYQGPGALLRMAETACTDFRGCHLVEGAGHWVQQEAPDEVCDIILNFLKSGTPGRSRTGTP